MIINIKNSTSSTSISDSEHKKGRGMRLYYEACIPAALFIATAVYHHTNNVLGSTAQHKGKTGGGDSESAAGYPSWTGAATEILTCILCVLMAAVPPLFLRMEWRRSGGRAWMAPSVAGGSGGIMVAATPLHTTGTMYRRSADDGIAWGVLLVPLVATAAELAYVSRGTGTPTTTTAISNTYPLGVLGWAEVRVISIAMGLRLALTALDARMMSGNGKHAGAVVCGGMRLPILALWVGSVFVLGSSVGASVWGSGALFGVAEMQQSALAYVVQALPRSFTLGEASIITQGVVLVTMDLAGKIVCRATAVDVAAHRRLWEPHVETLFLEAGIVGLVLLARLLVVAVATRAGTNGASTHMLGKRRGEAAVAVRAVAAACFCGALSLATAAYVSCTNPVSWIAATVFGSATSVAVCSYWIALLGCCGLVLYRATHTKGNISSQVAGVLQSKFVLHLKRKSYHVLAVLMFVPGYLVAHRLQHFAFTAALAVFVVAEAVRALDIPPWGCGRAIDRFVRKFTDYRDAGPVVTSHFYLLLGCAVPVWLGGSSAVACLAGVLALGLADTAASLVGMWVGRVRWPGTAKTIEGTAGFVVCLAVAAVLVDALASSDSPPSPDSERAAGAAAGSIAFLCAVLGVVEALTEQNDNLVLPLCMYAAVHVCAQMRVVAFGPAFLAVAAALAVMPRLLCVAAATTAAAGASAPHAELRHRRAKLPFV
ncbi:dolichol kinase [Coemansia sp. RSA 1200]|nr:dolichol kinase [Coemansia sp. RSA 1200]